MSDVLEEFQEGGRLSNYNTDGVSTIESVLIKKLQFVAVNDKTELDIPKFGYFSSWFFSNRNYTFQIQGLGKSYYRNSSLLLIYPSQTLAKLLPT